MPGIFYNPQVHNWGTPLAEQLNKFTDTRVAQEEKEKNRQFQLELLRKKQALATQGRASAGSDATSRQEEARDFKMLGFYTKMAGDPSLPNAMRVKYHNLSLGLAHKYNYLSNMKDLPENYEFNAEQNKAYKQANAIINNKDLPIGEKIQGLGMIIDNLSPGQQEMVEAGLKQLEKKRKAEQDKAEEIRRRQYIIGSSPTQPSPIIQSVKKKYGQEGVDTFINSIRSGETVNNALGILKKTYPEPKTPLTTAEKKYRDKQNRDRLHGELLKNQLIDINKEDEYTPLPEYTPEQAEKVKRISNQLGFEPVYRKITKKPFSIPLIGGKKPYETTEIVEFRRKTDYGKSNYKEGAVVTNNYGIRVKTINGRWKRIR